MAQIDVRKKTGINHSGLCSQGMNLYFIKSKMGSHWRILVGGWHNFHVKIDLCPPWRREKGKDSIPISLLLLLQR